MFPDGGMARLRLWGRPTADGRSHLGRAWFDALPSGQAAAVLAGAGATPDEAQAAAGARPVLDADPALPETVRRLLDGPAAS